MLRLSAPHPVPHTDDMYRYMLSARRRHVTDLHCQQTFEVSVVEHQVCTNVFFNYKPVFCYDCNVIYCRVGRSCVILVTDTHICGMQRG